MSREPTTKTAQPGHLVQTAIARYHRQLRRFLLRRAPHPQDAGDLLQEVYLRVLSVDRATLVRNPQAYMYGIAAHVAREFHARAQRERVTFDSEVIEVLTETTNASSGDDFIDGLDLERQVQKTLTRLSPTHLKVLVADRRDGLTQEQIAQKFGLSVHTVRKYLVQALTQVREGWYDQQRSGPMDQETGI